MVHICPLNPMGSTPISAKLVQHHRTIFLWSKASRRKIVRFKGGSQTVLETFVKPLELRYYIHIIAILLLTITGCAKDVVTGKKTYNWYSLNDDIKLGQQVIHQQLRALKKKKKAIDEEADPEMILVIREITRKIAAVSHFPNFPYEAHYADVDIVNAWCAPGGKVMVYSGLFDPKEGLVKRSERDELAAVLGHEMAHATARHVTESLSRNMSLAVIGQAASIAVGTTGSGIVQDLFKKVISKGIDVFVPSYSRKSEAEADRIGLIYMAKAGYNPKAVVGLWYRACKKRGDKTSLFASHPGSCERAKNLEKLLPQALKEYEHQIR